MTKEIDIIKLKPVFRKNVDKLLKCQLTQDEILAAGQALADAQSNMERLRDELAAYKAQINTQIAEAEAIANRNGGLIRQKYEVRKVDCEICKDYQNETVTITRMDTKEIVESRPMNREELSELPLEDSTNPKGK
jgi:DNA repair exonuclease SbcCD ATPase subunit